MRRTSATGRSAPPRAGRRDSGATRETALRTCTYDGDDAGLARSHPYTNAASNPTFRYLDLRASPGLIRTSLEDFTPWSHDPAIQAFYRLLERLNGPDSLLETNDCAFDPPAPDGAGHHAVSCSGRVMVLFRELPRNLSTGAWGAFVQGLHEALAVADPEFELGVIGTTLVRVHFRALPAADGAQLMISFWAWGATERACLANLARLIANLEAALCRVREP